MVEHLLVYGYNPSRHLRKLGRRPPSGQSPSATEWAWPIGLRWYPVSAKMSLATQQKHRHESPEPGPNAKKLVQEGLNQDTSYTSYSKEVIQYVFMNKTHYKL